MYKCTPAEPWLLSVIVFLTPFPKVHVIHAVVATSLESANSRAFTACLCLALVLAHRLLNLPCTDIESLTARHPACSCVLCHFWYLAITPDMIGRVLAARRLWCLQ